MGKHKSTLRIYLAIYLGLPIIFLKLNEARGNIKYAIHWQMEDSYLLVANSLALSEGRVEDFLPFS